MNTLIIQASARKNGDTHSATRLITKQLHAEAIDLLDYTLHPFRYDQTYPEGDQFLEVITHWVLPHEHILLATPIYWYTMSARLKKFMDRLSDLLMSDKHLGRRLRGKTLSVLSVSNDDDPPPHFSEPFRLTADYLGMTYGGHYHAYVAEEDCTITHQ